MIAGAVGAGRILSSLVTVLFGLLSLLAEFVVLTFTLTSPVPLQRSRKPGHVGTCAQAHLPFHKGRAGTFLMNICIFLTFFANIHIFLIFFEKEHFKLDISFNSSNIPTLTIQAHFG